MPAAQLLSIASHFPNASVDIDSATAYAQSMSCTTDAQRGKVAKLYRRTGVENRGSVLIENDADGRPRQDFYGPLLLEEEPGGTRCPRGGGNLDRSRAHDRDSKRSLRCRSP